MRGAVPERLNWASCPQGTCPTAPYKIQPPNQIYCELWRHVSHEVSPFHHTCFRNGGNRASVWWLHSSFCFAQYCNNMLTLTRWHTERVASSWKHVKVHADRIFRNSLTKRRISKKLKWTKSSLFFQAAANLKYGMQLLLNTFGTSILSNKKREHSIGTSSLALAMHRYQNSERKKLTDSIRITSFVEYLWSKTNVKASFQHSAHMSHHQLNCTRNTA